MKHASVFPMLVFAASTHFLVDAVAGTLNPLWPRLDPHFHLTAWHSAGLFLLWQMTTSVCQLFFGLYGDRFNARWLLWAGPLAAIVCLGSIGLSHSPILLAGLLLISGLGIAAYHPEAAALAGNCAPQHRSRAMSVFTMGGFLGQATGPVYSGSIVDRLGLPGLAWGIIAGVAIMVLLSALVRRAVWEPRHEPASRRRGGPANWKGMNVMWLVLVIGSLRIVAASGVPVLIGFLLTARQAGAADTGLVQGAFMLGIGLGGLACATLLRAHHERLILWLCPLLAMPAVVVVPWTSGVALAAIVCLSGLLLGVSLPVLISYGQQLMPHSPRIASSITMGVSWGFGGAIVALILAVCRLQGRYEPAFMVFGFAVLLSCILCVWLPAAGGQEASLADVDERSVSAVA